MTNKKKIIKKKIDLLIISLEILNIYFNISKNKSEFSQLNKDLSSISLKINDQFEHIIRYTYIIKIAIKKHLLHHIANDILRSYIVSNDTRFISKYIKKFHNTYCKQKEYYKNYKLLNDKSKININHIALTNLYIITKLIQKNGTHMLVKYLME
uniref:Uncharacterized protein n=1 Tax=Periphykon beckeri TaxID=2006982 RepID=A0A1Z1M3N2_9FLOR|nr:hypothetical protein [Periphykon beckeri]ARW60500.1 hypothetical protein [Periphykon beckeri]